MRKVIVFIVLCMTLLLAGCSGSSGGGISPTPDFIGHNGPPAFQDNPTQQSYNTAPAANNPGSSFVGTWVHSYEYFDMTYRTTLVINPDGSAVYYNEEAELGNYNASWSSADGGMSITIRRSDGVISTCRVQGSVLTEITEEYGAYYQADYQRQG